MRKAPHKHGTCTISPGGRWPIRLSGFTLIEILVVITLTSVLVAMLIPALVHARKAGMKAVCQSQFHQLGLGLGCYVHEHNGYTVAAYEHPTPNPLGHSYNWRGENYEFRECVINTRSTDEDSLALWGKFCYCPADPDPNAKFNWTYGVNIEVTGEDLANPAWNPLKRIEDSGAPSQKIFMMDTKALYFDWTYGIKEYYTKANGGFLGTLERIDRHTNGVNGLFLDGHVAFFSYSTAPDNCNMILADDQVSSFNCEIP